MKRLFASSLALSLLITPLAFAQQPPGGGGGQPPRPPQGHNGEGPGGGHQQPPPGHNAGPGGYQQPRPPPGPGMQGHNGGPGGYEQHGPPPGPGMQGPGPGMAWRRGDHFNVPPGQRRVVGDWHNHRGLYAPPPGQEWVQYNNQYMLVAITSGIIGAILGAAAASQ